MTSAWKSSWRRTKPAASASSPSASNATPCSSATGSVELLDVGEEAGVGDRLLALLLARPGLGEDDGGERIQGAPEDSDLFQRRGEERLAVGHVVAGLFQVGGKAGERGAQIMGEREGGGAQGGEELFVAREHEVELRAQAVELVAALAHGDAGRRARLGGCAAQ